MTMVWVSGSVETPITSATSYFARSDDVADRLASLRLKLEDLAEHPRVLGLLIHLDEVSALDSLYTAWDAAEPGKGYERKAAEWQSRIQAGDGSGSVSG